MMIWAVSAQLATVVPSGLVQVPAIPGPWTRTLLKPVGDPTTRCGVVLSPMNPAGGPPAAGDRPKVSQVRNGPIFACGPLRAAVKLPGIGLVSKRQPFDGCTSPEASAVQV